MPRVPTTSPATGEPTTSSFIHTTDCNFVDNAGRTLLLRGVNLSGASKAPVGHPSYILDDFWQSAEAGGESFVGRPLNLDDGSADIHLARLRGWGFNLLRFPFTWEALEHEGPGKYDYEFMDYTIRVLQKCKDYGFRVFLDPHQDTWSRFSGGSGAPFWTLAACGINPYNVTATQAAIVHCEYPMAHAPDPAELPAMVWSTNYGRLLSQTIFTLFFAGRDFAPNCIIDGMNIQDYLQRHFIEACGQLADRIREYDDGSLYDSCVIGWDSMNEPFEGLCGWDDLNVNPVAQGSTLKKGTYPTPAQSLRLGMGQAQTVDNWTFGVFGPSRNGTVTIDPKGRKLWAEAIASPNDGVEGRNGEMPDGANPRWGWKRDVEKWPLGSCVWALHGVWDIETGYVLRPDYFKFNPTTGEEVEFISDYWKPHWLDYSTRIRPVHPEAIWFVQPPVFAKPPEIASDELRGRCAYSSHYYDGLTLITRHWNWFNADALGLLRGKYNSTYQAVKIGEPAIRKSLHDQLGMLKSDAFILGQYPSVIGEIGTPYDMDDKRSYGWTDRGKYKGDYSRQEKALDASLNACDGINSLNYTIWTFCPDDHSHEWGDGWNMEDLSLWSTADVWEKQRESRWRNKQQQVDELDDSVHDERVTNDRGVLLNRKTSRPSTPARQDQPKPSIAMIAAASSLSIATLGTATLADTDSMKGEPSASIGWHSNPHDFLSDGARAVKAFCRPYPVKTVGRPSYIQFDINKASFKLVVTVNHEDKPNAEGLGRRSCNVRPASPSKYLATAGGGVPEEDDEPEAEEPLDTEVFIPLIHFAHPRLLQSEGRPGRRRRLKNAYPKKDADARSISTLSSNASDASLRATGRSTAGTSTAAASREATPEPPDLALAGSASLGSIATAVGCSGQQHLSLPVVGAAPIFPPCKSLQPRRTPIVPDAEDDGQDLLDVEVTVSRGRWRVEGQTLHWWYDVPGEGEPEREYTLEVKRRGGAVKAKDLESRVNGGSWCEQLCPPDGCTVM